MPRMPALTEYLPHLSRETLDSQCPVLSYLTVRSVKTEATKTNIRIEETPPAANSICKPAICATHRVMLVAATIITLLVCSSVEADVRAEQLSQFDVAQSSVCEIPTADVHELSGVDLDQILQDMVHCKMSMEQVVEVMGNWSAKEISRKEFSERTESKFFVRYEKRKLLEYGTIPPCKQSWIACKMDDWFAPLEQHFSFTFDTEGRLRHARTDMPSL